MMNITAADTLQWQVSELMLLFFLSLMWHFSFLQTWQRLFLLFLFCLFFLNTILIVIRVQHRTWNFFQFALFDECGPLAAALLRFPFLLSVFLLCQLFSWDLSLHCGTLILPLPRLLLQFLQQGLRTRLLRAASILLFPKISVKNTSNINKLTGNV